MSEDGYLSVSEAIEYTGRSRVWLMTEERKAKLIEGGAELGGRGQASRIPVSLLDSLGWKAEHSTHPEDKATEALRREIDSLEEEWADAKDKAATLGDVIKEKKAELTRTIKEAEKEAKKEARKVLRAKQKELAKAREEFERLRNEVEETEKLVG